MERRNPAVARRLMPGARRPPTLQSKIQNPKSKIECLLLTGGRSQRMGQDKAKLVIDGEPLGLRIATALATASYPVTVLGREPVPGFPFQLDAAEYEGPLSALSAYNPAAETVFVAACDMPRFDPRVVGLLAGILNQSPEAEAVIPVIEGRRQPLCALYQRIAWTFLPALLAEGRKSMMAWLDSVTVREVLESELQNDAIDPDSIRSVNSIEELDEFLNSP